MMPSQFCLKYWGDVTLGKAAKDMYFSEDDHPEGTPFYKAWCGYTFLIDPSDEDKWGHTLGRKLNHSIVTLGCNSRQIGEIGKLITDLMYLMYYKNPT